MLTNKDSLQINVLSVIYCVVYVYTEKRGESGGGAIGINIMLTIVVYIKCGLQFISLIETMVVCHMSKYKYLN